MTELAQNIGEKTTHLYKAVHQIHETLQDLVKFRAEPYEECINVDTTLSYEIYGSVKLGVATSKSDIDVCFIGPYFVTREIFFDFIQQSFDAEILLNARVPLAKIKLENRVEVDILYVQMPVLSRPASLQSLFEEDQLYRRLDDASIRSLCGPRTCIYLTRCMTNPNWTEALRLIRAWAKSRHLMSNVFGMPNAISYAIILARVQETMTEREKPASTEITQEISPEITPSLTPGLTPELSSASPLHSTASNELSTEELVRYFFQMMRMWKWDVAEIRNLEVTPEMPHIEWDGRLSDRPMHVITPCFPLVNTTYNVSPNTLAIWRREINRVYEKCFDLRDTVTKTSPKSSEKGLTRPSAKPKSTQWKDKRNPIHQKLRLQHFKALSRPLKLKCRHYIVVRVINTSDVGYVRSKLCVLMDLISRPSHWLIIPFTETIDDAYFLFGVKLLNKSQKEINLKEGFHSWKSMIKTQVECHTYTKSRLPAQFRAMCKV